MDSSKVDLAVMLKEFGAKTPWGKINRRPFP